jgi:hypothetical protein
VASSSSDGCHHEFCHNTEGANFPHYAIAATFAATPSLLLHNATGGLVHTHVPGFSWPNVTVYDVTQPMARQVIVAACRKVLQSGFIDGFFFDRVDDGCFERDYGHTLHPALAKALPAARELLVQEVQAAIGTDKLVVANHMFTIENVSGAMNEAWSLSKGPNGAASIWQNLALCNATDKVVEAHLIGGVNDDTVAAFLIGAGERALFGSGGWNFEGDGFGPRWNATYFERSVRLVCADVSSDLCWSLQHDEEATRYSYCHHTSQAAAR